MKKVVWIIIFAGHIACTMYAQSFDWNLRGGLNLMDSRSMEDKLSVYGHAGLQAGVRIASFGFYGEAVYSVLENQYGGDPIGYFAPSLILKGYVLKVLFFEFGGTMLNMAGDSGIADDLRNPDGDIFFAAGLGAHLSRMELSLRSTAKQSYGVIQLTAAIKF